MREILFKAKRIDNGEWVEGYYVYDYGYNRHYIFTNEVSGAINVGFNNRANYHLKSYTIDPETLCQYTGLTDKNDAKIWENDVVRYTDDIISKDKIDLIEYNETHASFVRLHKSQMGLQYLYINEAIAGKCEVIGNIFDNPELLEVADE